jgi:rubrerythrin
MATMVGTQSIFEDALYELCELDYDAAEAYEAAINRLEKKEYKEKLVEFKKDHHRHIDEIRSLLAKQKAKIPEGPSAKSILTQGKVVLGNLFGDKSILKAMLSNEEDTNTAYERLNNHPEKSTEADAFLRQGLKDEKKHKQWLESIIEEHQKEQKCDEECADEHSPERKTSKELVVKRDEITETHAF